MNNKLKYWWGNKEPESNMKLSDSIDTPEIERQQEIADMINEFIQEDKIAKTNGFIKDLDVDYIELHKSIQEFEDNALHESLKPEISSESKTVALKCMFIIQNKMETCQTLPSNSPVEVEYEGFRGLMKGEN